ncbi:MAG: hypothetical protein K9K37_09635 [Desulfocapsa sp.]|nr:hypothetical protein [Desulfocapsa sp.]
MQDTLTSLQLIVDSGLFILIWLVQLIIYPSFRYIEEKVFLAWHSRYTVLIGLVVTPLMLLQAGGEAVHFWQQDLRWQRIAIISGIWIATFILSVPCHKRLHEAGKDLPIIDRLVLTNWIRTLLWSILFLETVFTTGIIKT